ncbi:MAG: T9SS type A sorting domain-containing protein [Cytophagales bacterium]|nr:T9SS type A sorting domain-containing protein [Cytophagales bacterium]
MAQITGYTRVSGSADCVSGTEGAGNSITSNTNYGTMPSILTRDVSSGDFTFDASGYTANAWDNANYAIIWRYSSGNYYALTVRNSSPNYTYRLKKNNTEANSTTGDIATWTGTSAGGAIQIVVSGTSHQVYVGGVLRINVTDASYASGSVGFGQSVGSDSRGWTVSEAVWTIGSIPSVTTTSDASVSCTKQNLTGEVTSNGGSAITERGFIRYEGGADDREIGDAGVTKISEVDADIESYTLEASSLSESTTYKYRAYATNSNGTAYGIQQTFTTVACSAPTVVATVAATSVTCFTADPGGNVTADGGATITERGLAYGTSPNPTTSDTKSIQAGTTGAWTGSLTGLTHSQLYYVRAYAINSVGTSYGTQTSFTTSTCSIPIVEATVAAGTVTCTTADPGGNVTADGGATITERGLVYGINPNPTTSDTKSIQGGTTGSWTGSLSSLSGNTLYYVRAYATNSIGTSYGTQTSFTTSWPCLPIVPTTNAASAITGFAATSGGNVTGNNGYPLSAKGVVWNTAGSPTTGSNLGITNEGTTVSSFISSITGLSASTTYYVRAYATNANGTTYGPEISFTTLSPPTVAATVAAGTVTCTTADPGGNVTSDGGSTITERGLVYGTSSNPTTSDTKSIQAGTTGSWTGSLSSLTGNTLYYVRAYAINGVGTSYGTQTSFTTSWPCLPIVPTTDAASSITAYTATSGGNVTSNNGYPLSAKGIVWNTAGSPTTTSNLGSTNEGTTVSSFVSSLTSLTSTTTYYVRAYATNANGTTYGPEISFTTSATGVPQLAATVDETFYSCNDANPGGNVTGDGNDPITERGLVYATSPNPTIADTKVTEAGTTGSWTGYISGLSSSTTYYVRAYATNSIGTGYGTQISFTTDGSCPTFMTKHNVGVDPLDWTNAAHWVGGVVPDINAFNNNTVGIRHNMTHPSSYTMQGNPTASGNYIRGPVTLHFNTNFENKGYQIETTGGGTISAGSSFELNGDSPSITGDVNISGGTISFLSDFTVTTTGTIAATTTLTTDPGTGTLTSSDDITAGTSIIIGGTTTFTSSAGDITAPTISFISSNNSTINNAVITATTSFSATQDGDVITTGGSITTGELILGSASSHLDANGTPIQINGNIAITGAGSMDLDGTSPITITGNYTNSGNVDVSFGANFTMTGTPAANGNFTNSGSSTPTFSGTAVVPGDFSGTGSGNTVVDGTLDIGGTLLLIGSAELYGTGVVGYGTGDVRGFSSGGHFRCGGASGTQYDTEESPGVHPNIPFNPLNLVTCEGGVLPVELAHFRVRNDGYDNYISWFTVSEINSEKFEVYSSIDGQSWKMIETVAAAGNSNRELAYSVFDPSEIGWSRKYYRLKQVDIDGKYVYSKVLVVTSGEKPIEVKCFPNPTSGIINIDMSALDNQEVSIKLFDAVGKLVESRALKVSKSVINFNCSYLTPGFFNVIIQDQFGNKYHTSFIKREF